MHGFYLERRALPMNTPLSKDLVQHIFTRGAKGSVVVVSEKPQDLAAIAKKQWHVMNRLVQRERASTLKLARIAELSNQIRWMERMSFIAKPIEELPDYSIIFATAEALVLKPPICSTLYITQEVTDEQFHFMTSWLHSDSIVVIYGKYV